MTRLEAQGISEEERRQLERLGTRRESEHLVCILQTHLDEYAAGVDG